MAGCRWPGCSRPARIAPLHDTRHSPRGAALRVAAWLAALVVLTGGSGPQLHSEVAEEAVSFRNQIAPILLTHCQTCHNAGKARGEFQVQRFDLLLKPGSSDLAPVVPGKPDESELFRRLTASNPDDRMPQKADPLPADRIELVRRWIEQGALFDGEDRHAELAGLVPRPPHPKPPERYRHPVPAVALAFHPAAEQIAVGGYHEVTIWHPGSGALLRRIPGVAQRTQSVLYHSNGSQLIVAGGTPGMSGEVALIDTGKESGIRVLGTAADMFMTACLSPDGDQLAVGGADSTIRIYELPAGAERLRIQQHADWVMGLAFNSDGTLLASGSRDRSSRVYDTKTGDLVASYVGYEVPVYGVGFDPKGELVYAAGSRGTIHAWNVKDGKKVKEFEVSEGPVFRMLFQGGEWFCGSADGCVRRFSGETGKVISKYARASAPVYGLAYDAGGERLAAGNHAGEVAIWSIPHGELLTHFVAAPGFEEVRPVVIETAARVLPGIKAPKGPAPRQDPPDQLFRRAPTSASSRTIAIPVATNLHVGFDTHLLRVHTAWEGPSLRLYGPPHHGGKTPFLARMDGTVLWTTPPFFPWQMGRISTNDLRELPAGARFDAISTRRGFVMLRYRIPGEGNASVSVEESFRAQPAGGPRAIVRRLEIGPCATNLFFLAHGEMGHFADSPGTGQSVLIQREPGRDYLLTASLGRTGAAWRTVTTNVSYEVSWNGENDGESVVHKTTVAGRQARAFLEIPPHSEAIAIEIASVVCSNRSEAERVAKALSMLEVKSVELSPPEARMPAPPTVAGASGSRFRPGGDAYYEIERFPVPRELDLLVGGMDWLANGDLAICTWPGEVYVVENAEGPPGKAVYRRFARGLNEPLGLKVVNNQIYVVQKCELTRLTDTDGNGEADLYENINADWGFTGNYHAYAFGPLVDAHSNFFVLLCAQRGLWEFPYLGWAVEIDPVSHRLEPFCSGLRAPNGWECYGEDLFATDNQGNWLGACKLNHLKRGRFYGFPSAWPAPREDWNQTRPFQPPAVWFPRALSPSASDIETIRDERFGPFQGQLLVGDFQNGTLMRVMLEKVGGEWQGAVWPFAKGFVGAVNRLSFGPDGNLYVGGCKRAWSTPAPQEYSLERVRFTGKAPFEIREAHATANGFELVFTEPVDRAKAEDLQNYGIEQFRYEHHPEYGSPEIDQAGEENSSTTITVEKAAVSPDGSRVRLTLSGALPGYVTMVQLADLTSAGGTALWHDTFYYTLNAIPEAP